MEKMKHTPGKWVFKVIYDNERNQNMISIHQKGWNTINDGDNGLSSIAGIWDDSEQSKANAKLIATAPELLETLQELTEGVQDQINHHEISSDNIKLVKNALKVIERATA
jgi:hypothetical protein